tara:strand:+ start:86 stop:487 length:402 start_codon:yes stop_codon:yes gene_type:complete
MKFTNGLFLNEKFMQTVAKCNEYEDWEPKGAYWFNRLVKKLSSAQEDFTDVKNKLIKKYGDEPDKEGNVQVSKENIPEFTIAINEILEEEFEIDGIKPIKFPEGLKLSPIEMGYMEEIVDMSAFLNDEDGDED